MSRDFAPGEDETGAGEERRECGTGEGRLILASYRLGKGMTCNVERCAILGRDVREMI